MREWTIEVKAVTRNEKLQKDLEEIEMNLDMIRDIGTEWIQVSIEWITLYKTS
jgi:hypothetical protein